VPAAQIRKTAMDPNRPVDPLHLNHISSTRLLIQQPVRWGKELGKKREIVFRQNKLDCSQAFKVFFVSSLRSLFKF
jgi:hypothetical protein